MSGLLRRLAERASAPAERLQPLMTQPYAEPTWSAPQVAEATSSTLEEILHPEEGSRSVVPSPVRIVAPSAESVRSDQQDAPIAEETRILSQPSGERQSPAMRNSGQVAFEVRRALLLPAVDKLSAASPPLTPVLPDPVLSAAAVKPDIPLAIPLGVQASAQHAVDAERGPRAPSPRDALRPAIPAPDTLPRNSGRAPAGEMEVHVHIGRIEVRAVQAPAVPRRADAQASRPLSLDEYLKDRGGGR